MFVAFLAYLKFSGEIHSRTELLECWRLVGPEVAGPADSKRWTLAAPLLPTASSNQALWHGYSPGILDKMWRRYLFWCSRVRDVPSRWYIFIRMLIRLSMQDPIIKTIYLVDQSTSYPVTLLFNPFFIFSLHKKSWTICATCWRPHFLGALTRTFFRKVVTIWLLNLLGQIFLGPKVRTV